MSESRFELPADRLSTTDDTGARIYLQPDIARGRFHRLRNRVQPVLLVIFLAIPWIHVNGKPLVLLDIPGRRFILFGGTFWAHDAPLVMLVIGLFTVFVALVTSLWGRVWCGWACPQTVFIEAVFRRIERFTEGIDRSYRHAGRVPLTPERKLRKIAKWVLYLLATLVLSHSFLAYFVGLPELHRMMLRSPSEAPGSFLFMSLTTCVLLFDFGWFREQFCIIACPYGRIQSLFMDDQTKVVAYDYRRGEPRRGDESAGARGDCVNCFRCVQVCPTGIDIRRGTQLECIGCTACIDACDDVMTKTHKPCGLIRHDSGAVLAGGARRTWRPRIFALLTLFIVLGLALAFGLSTHEQIQVSFLRAVGEPYQLIEEASGPSIVNHFHAEIWNGTESELRVGLEAAAVTIVTAENPVTVAARTKKRVDFFVKFKRASRARLLWTSDGKASGTEEVELVGPIR